MPSVEVTPIDSASIDTEDNYELDTIGIEFEYPVARGDGPGVANAQRSPELRDNYGYNPWTLDDYVPDEVPVGNMTGDHVGAEITSSQLDLHSDHPELWYAGTIERATEMGYPFAATGQGATNFGLHLHLSELREEKAAALFDMCQEKWMRVFACTSIGQDTMDPWRHGGVGTDDINGLREFGSDRQYVVNDRNYGSDVGHYEWRLPEPMQMDHFMVMMRFLRILEVEGAENARDYAKGMVENADDRLTAVRQYQYLRRQHGDDYPTSRAMTDSRRTDADAAEYFHELMQDNGL